jgi:heme oxygenase (biliverdin-IX-beta and delta-forming)
MLSTLSLQHAGYPFGSLVPYVLDHRARPIILVSRLAEHTKNMRADPRTSLLAHNDVTDPQAGARLTLLGQAMPIDASSPAARRYRRFFPNSESLLDLGDFLFFALDPVSVRFIEGFGSIHWISAADYAPPENSLSDAEGEILEHANSDARSLREYCSRSVLEAKDVTMIGLDCDGFDVSLRDDTGYRLLRFRFERPVTDAAGARAALVALAGASRAA